jgi:hypothetical protein
VVVVVVAVVIFNPIRTRLAMFIPIFMCCINSVLYSVCSCHSFCISLTEQTYRPTSHSHSQEMHFSLTSSALVRDSLPQCSVGLTIVCLESDAVSKA